MDEHGIETLASRFQTIANQQPTRDDLEAQQARLAEEAKAAQLSFVGFVIAGAALVSKTLQGNGVRAEQFESADQESSRAGFVLRKGYAYGGSEYPNEKYFGVWGESSRESRMSWPENRGLIVKDTGELAIVGFNTGHWYVVNDEPLPEDWHRKGAVTSRSSGKALESVAQTDMEAAVARYSQGR